MTLTKVLKHNSIKVGPIPPEMTYLKLDKIQVLGSKSFPDCTCIETVLFKFYFCTVNGAIPVSDNRFIIETEIETGYRPEESVETDMRRMLSQYPIFDLEKLLAAFKYRDYYSHKQH